MASFQHMRNLEVGHKLFCLSFFLAFGRPEMNVLSLINGKFSMNFRHIFSNKQTQNFSGFTAQNAGNISGRNTRSTNT